MYLHLGGETVVKTSEVVAILNLENIDLSSTVQEQLKTAVMAHGWGKEAQGAPKSLIITDSKAYASPISSATLMKRASSFADLGNNDFNE